MLEMVFVVSVAVLAFLTVVVLIVEGGIVGWWLRKPLPEILKITVRANILSFLAAIPLMVLDRVALNQLLPWELHDYFRVLFWVTLLSYVVYWLVTVLVEWVVWKRALKRLAPEDPPVRLFPLVVLFNVLTYLILAPIHYRQTAPKHNVEEFTADTTWALEPRPEVYYLSHPDGFLMKTDTAGSFQEVVFPYPMRDALLSEDKQACAYVDAKDSLYFIPTGASKPIQVDADIWHLFDLGMAAIDHTGMMLGYVDSTSRTEYLNVVDSSLTRAARTIASMGSDRRWNEPIQLAWLTDGKLSVHQPGGAMAFDVFEASPTASHGPISDASIVTNYGAFFHRLEGSEDHVDCGELSIHCYHQPFIGGLYISREKELNLQISDSLGFLRLPHRGFYNPCFLHDCREVLVDDGRAIYLIDVEKKRVGFVAHGRRAFVPELKVYQKAGL